MWRSQVTMGRWNGLRFILRYSHHRNPLGRWFINPQPRPRAGEGFSGRQNIPAKTRDGTGIGRAVARNAFTLIEVLVVVAIIALLVAILIPSLIEARNQAQAAVCASNLKQGVYGVILTMVEARMKKEVWSTNFGWAVSSLKQNKGQSEIFTCPSDPNPRPIPAVFDRLYSNGKDTGTTSGDAIFNRVKRLGGDRWVTDIQDQVHGARLGGDAYSDPATDCLVSYTASKGQHFAQAQVQLTETGYQHNLYSYKGTFLWNGVSGSSQFEVPLLWMSYGANAAAGMKNVKGNPVLLVEAGKLGVFPEHLRKGKKAPRYYADHLGKALRFRHGSRTNQPGLGGVGSDFTVHFPLPTVETDKHYEPREKMNTAYLDGHVERLAHHQMFTLHPTEPDLARPRLNRNLWIGKRQGAPMY